MKPSIPAALRQLAAIYTAAGHEIVLVGGCVRDALLGLQPKDVDLATSATPMEQIEIYLANGIRYFETGLQHGTITALVDDAPYEITTYRTDEATDGRHATVAYTRDLITDLERRDLTINAMAMTFEGKLVDPFGGAADLAAGRVRFVGAPDARIREDYLRILRWFRFLGRFAAPGSITPDAPSVEAIRANIDGLSIISVERIWSEVSRILTGPNAAGVIQLMIETGAAGAIGLPSGDALRLEAANRQGMDAATILGGYLSGKSGAAAAMAIARSWKVSNEDRFRSTFVAHRVGLAGYDLAEAKRDVVNGAPSELAAAVLRLSAQHKSAETLEAWDTPAFPVSGNDLLAAGMKEGRELGVRMRAMRAAWIASDYTLDRDALLVVA